MKQSWATKKLGDLCEFQRGLTYAKGDEVNLSNNVVLRATNIDLASNLLVLDELKYINDKIEVPQSKRIKKDSLLICTASGSKVHLGKVAYIDEDYGFAFGGFMGLLTPKAGLVPKYLYYLMISERYRDFIDQLSDGVNINNLKFDDLKLFPVPQPPSEDQARIVMILDDAFAAIANAKAYNEKNLHNTGELFNSLLDSTFRNGRSGWAEKSVGELVAEGVLEKPFDGNHGELHPVKANYRESGVPFIMACDLVDGKVDTDNCKFISRELADSLRVGFAKDGDVLISHKGTIGRSAIIQTDDEYIMLTPQVTSYRVKNSETLFNRYLRYYFMCPEFQSAINAGAADGSTRAYIGITKQLTLRIRYPELPEQKRIVSKLDELAPATQSLSAIYRQEMNALESLKKSLLHNAFAGAL